MLLKCSINKDFIYIIPFFFVNFILIYIEKDLFPYFNFISSVSKIFLIIFYILEKYHDKNDIKEKSDKKTKSLSEIIVCIICYILFKIINNHIELINKVEKDEEYLLIIFFFLIQLCFFQKNIYIHHLISLFIMMILIIWTLILHFYVKDIFYYILYTLNGYCFCFSMLLIEYINRKYFINVYLLGSILGICETIQYFIEKRSPRIEIKLSFLFLLFFISYIINYFLHFTIILKIGTIHSYMSDFISYFLLKSVYNFEISMNFLFSLISILTSLI